MYTYKYPRPSLTADILVVDTEWEHVLLIKRGHDPYKGCWAFPGGFFDMNDDTIMATAQRELEEETGISDIAMQELFTASRKGRDPRGRTVSVVFLAEVNRASVNPHSGDDADEAKWFSIEELPNLAFDHAEIMEKAIKAHKER